MGFVSVSECCQPQRERPRQDGPNSVRSDLCHRSNSPAHHPGPPPHLSVCMCHLYFRCCYNETKRRQGGYFLCFLSSVSQGYLLGCAESVANQSESKQIPDCLRWLFTPLGRQFFLSCDWSVKSDSSDEVFTSQRDPGVFLSLSMRLLQLARLPSHSSH